MNKHENKKYCSSDEIWCTQRKELIKSVLETKKASDLGKVRISGEILLG